MIGVRPVIDTKDPLVGFSGNIPLYVETSAENGSVTMTTAENKTDWFNKQSFPKIKPKYGYRIFCVGGSTTVGRPYRHNTSFCGWLEQYLKRSDPGRNWEVINAGGVSYASYRVTRLMTELVQYQPDMFIVYSGQNEFLEHRSYGKLKVLPYWLTYSDAMLSKTRTYAAVKMVVDAVESDTDLNNKPFEMSDEVDEVLTHTLGPTSYHRDLELKQQIIHHYRSNLERMVNIARQADSEIVFINPASNLKDMSPFKSEHKEGLSESLLRDWNYLYQKGHDKLQKGNYGSALEDFMQAREVDDQYADLHYRIGQVQFELENYEQAEESFWRAVDEDVAPLRILSEMRDVVSDVAEWNALPLIDFQKVIKRAYEDENKHSVFGKEYFLDHVHPTIKSNQLLGFELFDKLTTLNVVSPTVPLDENDIDDITQQVISKIDKEQQRRALMKLGRVFDWAGKFEEAFSIFKLSVETVKADAFGYNMMAKTAYRAGQYDEAVKYFHEALKIDPTVAKSYAFLGNIMRQKVRIKEAAKYYEEAVRLSIDDVSVYISLAMIFSSQGEHDKAQNLFEITLRMDPHNETVIFNYAVMLSKAGKYEQSIAQAKNLIDGKGSDAEVHNIIGIAYAKKNEFEMAMNHFNEALELKPGFKPASDNLASLMAEREATERD